jgi:hypothetical protein
MFDYLEMKARFLLARGGGGVFPLFFYLCCGEVFFFLGVLFI